MKKLTLLFVMMLVTALTYGQVTFTGVNWVSWGDEPEYDGVTGYDENPYDDREFYTVYKAPDDWTPVATVDDFDATWDVLEDAEMVAKPGNTSGGDFYDLGDGDTFGAQWKAVHDGEKLYVLLHYSDLNGQIDTDSWSFEIMAQPKDPVRHEPTFDAGVDADDMAQKNMAYGRYVELGGGKALFTGGAVTEYAASIGLTGSWGDNQQGLADLLEQAHFWNAADGVLKAVMVMSFDGALSYPDDPEDLDGDRTALTEGTTFAFDVKSGGAVGEDKVEYWWGADKNNGYASNYYSGHVTILPGESDVVFTGVNWVSWGDEPEYDGVTGYDENPYDDREFYTVYKAPDDWTPVATVDDFDATWDVLEDAEMVAKPGNTSGGDFYDLGDGDTFGAQWKAVHDGEKLYVLLHYSDLNGQIDTDSWSFEIMAQPKDPVRHEPTFDAGVDADDMAQKNMAYGRYVELGGGKALFTGGAVTEYAASIGLTGSWGDNQQGLADLLEQAHFWNAADGVLKAVMVMSFDGALSYPDDPEDLDGDRTALTEGTTFAFDVKSGGAVGDDKVEYWWGADKNNGYASNYYSGHVTISSEYVGDVNVSEIISQENGAYVYNGILHVRGSEAASMVEVYNVLGAKVKEAQNVRQLPLNDLNNGIYIVRINGERNAFKVIKN
ncbi:MAG: T9SS type A sorting domain-containing protein [Bacteroidales bacterium]